MFCPKCGANIPEGTRFCPVCGAGIAAEAPQADQTYQQAQPLYQQPYAAPETDAWDHTAEFDPKDIADTKLYCMLIYLAGIVGVLLALFTKKDSEYLKFHLRQGLKFIVIEAVTALATGVLVWTIIVPLAGTIFLGILFVIKIICFFQVCGNKAKEPAIIRSFGFLN